MKVPCNLIGVRDMFCQLIPKESFGLEGMRESTTDLEICIVLLTKLIGDKEAGERDLVSLLDDLCKMVDHIARIRISTSDLIMQDIEDKRNEHAHRHLHQNIQCLEADIQTLYYRLTKLIGPAE